MQYAHGGDRSFWCKWDGADRAGACPLSCGSCAAVAKGATTELEQGSASGKDRDRRNGAGARTAVAQMKQKLKQIARMTAPKRGAVKGKSGGGDETSVEAKDDLEVRCSRLRKLQKKLHGRGKFGGNGHGRLKGISFQILRKLTCVETSDFFPSSLSSPFEQSFFSTLGLGGTDKGGETAHNAGKDINSWFDSIAEGESHPGEGHKKSAKSLSAAGSEGGEFTAAQDRYFDEVLKTYGPQAEKLAEVRLLH